MKKYGQAMRILVFSIRFIVQRSSAHKMVRMKRIGKILLILMLVLITWCTKSTAGHFRNIFTLTYLDYSSAGTAKIYENALIARMSSAASLLIKAYYDDRSDWHNTIVTFGPVFNLDRYHYIEITYGYGFDSDKLKADYFAVELTREKPRYLMGIGFKHSAYPGYSYNIFSPSARYYLMPQLALWGKYFASVDSDGNFDHAYWVDGEYNITRKFALRLGFTRGNRLYSPEYETTRGGRADMDFFSLLAQVSYVINDRFIIKYLYENLLRQSKYTDIKNILILDIRF